MTDTFKILDREVTLPPQYRIVQSGPAWNIDLSSGTVMLRMTHKSMDTGPLHRFLEVVSQRIVRVDISDGELGQQVIDMATELVMHDLFERVNVDGKHPVEPHLPISAAMHRVGQFKDQ